MIWFGGRFGWFIAASKHGLLDIYGVWLVFGIQRSMGSWRNGRWVCCLGYHANHWLILCLEEIIAR
jgi:hypothetical protein